MNRAERYAERCREEKARVFQRNRVNKKRQREKVKRIEQQEKERRASLPRSTPKPARKQNPEDNDHTDDEELVPSDTVHQMEQDVVSVENPVEKSVEKPVAKAKQPKKQAQPETSRQNRATARSNALIISPTLEAAKARAVGVEKAKKKRLMPEEKKPVIPRYTRSTCDVLASAERDANSSLSSIDGEDSKRYTTKKIHFPELLESSDDELAPINKKATTSGKVQKSSSSRVTRKTGNELLKSQKPVPISSRSMKKVQDSDNSKPTNDGITSADKKAENSEKTQNPGYSSRFTRKSHNPELLEASDDKVVSPEKAAKPCSIITSKTRCMNLSDSSDDEIEPTKKQESISEKTHQFGSSTGSAKKSDFAEALLSSDDQMDTSEKAESTSGKVHQCSLDRPTVGTHYSETLVSSEEKMELSNKNVSIFGKEHQPIFSSFSKTKSSYRNFPESSDDEMEPSKKQESTAEKRQQPRISEHQAISQYYSESTSERTQQTSSESAPKKMLNRDRSVSSDEEMESPNKQESTSERTQQSTSERAPKKMLNRDLSVSSDEEMESPSMFIIPQSTSEIAPKKMLNRDRSVSSDEEMESPNKQESTSERTQQSTSEIAPKKMLNRDRSVSSDEEMESPTKKAVTPEKIQKPRFSSRYSMIPHFPGLREYFDDDEMVSDDQRTASPVRAKSSSKNEFCVCGIQKDQRKQSPASNIAPSGSYLQKFSIPETRNAPLPEQNRNLPPNNFSYRELSAQLHEVRNYLFDDILDEDLEAVSSKDVSDDDIDEIDFLNHSQFLYPFSKPGETSKAAEVPTEPNGDAEAGEADTGDVDTGVNGPFACDKCTRSFTTKYKLKAHEQVHSSTPQVCCTQCGLKIHHRVNYKNHLYRCIEAFQTSYTDYIEEVKYPDFTKALEAAANNPTLPMPKFEDFNMPFKMDKRGFVTGVDPTLATYKLQFRNGVVDDDDSEEDSGDEQD